MTEDNTEPEATTPVPDPAAELAKAETVEIANLLADGRAAAQQGRVVRMSMAKLAETASLCEMQAAAREAQVQVIQLRAELRLQAAELARRTAQVTTLEEELAEARSGVARIRPKGTS
jgi:hypothetical protein